MHRRLRSPRPPLLSSVEALKPPFPLGLGSGVFCLTRGEKGSPDQDPVRGRWSPGVAGALSGSPGRGWGPLRPQIPHCQGLCHLPGVLSPGVPPSGLPVGISHLELEITLFKFCLHSPWMLEAGGSEAATAQGDLMERPHIATSPSAARPPRAQEARNLWGPALKGGEGNPAEGQNQQLIWIPSRHLKPCHEPDAEEEILGGTQGPPSCSHVKTDNKEDTSSGKQHSLGTATHVEPDQEVDTDGRRKSEGSGTTSYNE
ncbi:uncharacterized protein [Symphalangus syndactylus]|uniref:uncharacterized protein n=1 Tax=Symphalangus syndactylus TaxID=9590 RepID=UPI003003AC5E